MAYRKYKLGDLVEQYDEINLSGEFADIDDLQGINSNKYFQECKSNKNDIDLYRYRICRQGMFSYNRATSRNGEKISIALRTGGDCIVSPSYYCFRVKDEDVLCPEYLDIWFKRPVFDRYARFNSWGSATEFFTFDDFCATEIMLPSISEQRKIVHDYQVITNRIELLRKMNENLEEQIIVVFNDFVERFADDHEETTLGNITSLICRGVAPDYDETSSQIVLNQKCIRDHAIDFTLSRTHLPKTISDKWLKRGDLLINSTGAGTLGRTALALFDMSNVTVDSHVSIVRPENPKMAYYLGTWAMVHEAEIEGLQEGSTGQTELPRERLVNMLLKVPNDILLKRFNKIVIPYFELRLNYQYETDVLKQLVDRLVSSLGSQKGA